MSLKEKLLNLLKWIGLCFVLGLLGGVLGAAFSRAISFVTNIRTQHGWLILLLPLAALASVFVFKVLKVDSMGTNQVLKSAGSDNCLSPLLAPAIFLGSVISHLFGASVGREGAALQLGGSLATALANFFKLNDENRRLLVYCGMAALFSAVFGTPIAAFLFAVEVVYVGKIKFKDLPRWKGYRQRWGLRQAPNSSLLLLAIILDP